MWRIGRSFLPADGIDPTPDTRLTMPMLVMKLLVVKLLVVKLLVMKLLVMKLFHG
jgi:hypothetical protein